MKLEKKLLIAIGREYGSGGRVIAEELGKRLDIPVFDKNMISMIAKKHGFDEDTLTSEDERLSSPFLEPYIPYGLNSGALSERLFTLQSKIIREEADKGSAIFVGRCADDILKKYDGLVRIFIYAPRNDRIARIMEREQIEDNLAADKIVKRTDKARKSYYQFYTDKKWESYASRDLMINSAVLGIDGTVDLILSFLKGAGYISD